MPYLGLIDPFDGLADLAAGVLRTPVTPQQSFDDDPLRMMRAVRFVSQLGMDLEPGTAAAVREQSARVSIVSAERVREGLVKLIMGEQPRHGLEVVVDLGSAESVQH